ncbi:serine/threonine protein kinase [Pyxidicoccus trucidator]|uniref:serine/threonine protein kinase n=1 Tax=Pyxidicoccus trucidator TaxID=2709662 RepID=UPI0013DBB8C7|nr:serine/threonine-protein kinase [Pyxidicoccus trucidator]
MEPVPLNPACLPPGTRIGSWRVVEQRGRGSYGAVYRAVDAERGAGDSVALKLALHPWDARFMREAELLSRIRHPAVPRLRDQGQWMSPTGTPHAWLAMELVEGTPLYIWAQAHLPTSRQVLRVLARLARALEATHAAGGVHRDVKGDNVLVRREDGQPFLMDFGSGHYLGAATLTWRVFPPGTQAYRSPEAWRYGLRFSSPPVVPYAPGPADDVFALGVTAFRVLTEKYPPPTHPEDEDAWLWRPEEMESWSARATNARCCPELSELVSRMLSPRPEARGSPRELAEALERAARKAGPAADVSLFTGDEPRLAGLMPVPQYVTVRPRRVARWPWFAAAAGLGGALALSAGGVLRVPAIEEPATAPLAQQEESRDGGTVAVGDTALTAPVAPGREPSVWSTIAVEMPPKPLPGQSRPDATGRCPRRMQVPLNGGCWVKVSISDMKECDESAYVYKGGCYEPAFPSPRPATSGPTRRADSP